MNKIPRYVCKYVAPYLSEEWVLNRTFPCFLPFYHVVSNVELPHILNYPYFNVAQFEKQLDIYLKYFKPASLDDVVSGICTGKRMFHLSFDDGLRQCAEVVAPILLRKGIPATFFINTAFVGNRKLFYRYKASLILSTIHNKTSQQVEKFLELAGLGGKQILSASASQESILDEAAGMLELLFDDFLNQEEPYMSQAQIKKLASDGFTIGAHSHSHPEFWKLTEVEQFAEVKTSMDWVVQQINPEIRAFSFPFTDSGVPLSLFKWVEREGICDVTFGTAGIKYDEVGNNFQRYPVEHAGDFINNLKAEILYFELRKWIGKATVKH